MKKEDIIDAVGELDERTVAETGKLRENRRGGTRKKVLFSVIAAILVLSVAGAALGVMNMGRAESKASSPAEDAETGPATRTADEAESGAPSAGEGKTEVVVKAYSDKLILKSDGKSGGETGVKADGEIGAAGRDYEGYGEGPGDGDSPVPGEAPDGVPGEDAPNGEPGEAFRLTAAVWRDLDNWPFFMNLVNSEKISFPAYGIDPTRLVRVRVTDADGAALSGERVDLTDADGAVIFSAVTDKTGTAYLFWGADDDPAAVISGEARGEVVLKADTSGEQGAERRAVLAEDVTLTTEPKAAPRRALQVSFIIDTTGSMGDELAYLQKDFSSIAGEVGADGVFWSVNFYRDHGDEYVTKCNSFTDNVDDVKALLMNEYCDGGGDFPEAVAEILTEAITDNGEWADDCEKIAFLIFDASPHEGTEEALVAAVRSAAARGVRMIPVVASGSQRDTELFGRAIAAVTGGTYVFLTDDSGVGGEHLEPIIGDYEVELLHDVIVRIINEYKAG
ncbi:MAG: hypothetical protein IJS78_02555 [Clostridia bacterium]|nr:hypothetical protein [Clostridia bacterium]